MAKIWDFGSLDLNGYWYGVGLIRILQSLQILLFWWNKSSIYNTVGLWNWRKAGGHTHVRFKFRQFCGTSKCLLFLCLSYNLGNYEEFPGIKVSKCIVSNMNTLMYWFFVKKWKHIGCRFETMLFVTDFDWMEPCSYKTMQCYAALL